jgi:uncharacterized membrane protein (UPF0127 family)
MASRLLAVVLALLAVSARAAGPEANPPLPTGTLTVAGRVTLTVELARSPLEQMRGLSHRPRLAEGQGMVFVYGAPQPVGIWMKDMRFPLDILWVREGRIVKIQKDAPPLAPGGPERVYTATADLVLEVPAGFTDRAGIRVGDGVKLRTQ